MARTAKTEIFHSADLFLGQIGRVNPDLDLPLIKKAVEFCFNAHRNQFRRSGEPFQIHAIEVAKILVELKMDSATVCAGLLHDVLEDTMVTHDVIKTEFGGTVAADEAVILLAQVRLLQDQPNLAAEGLQEALAGLSDQFKAPAYGLLGSALENIGNLTDAASAYEDAARTSWYDAVAAQYLNDAARASWGAGEMQRAIQLYERVISEYSESTSAPEARVRLGELRAAVGDMAPSS